MCHIQGMTLMVRLKKKCGFAIILLINTTKVRMNAYEIKFESWICKC